MTAGPRAAAGASSDGPIPVGSLARTYDVALLDLDGVVYVGPDAVPHAVGSLEAARAVGMRSCFVTNNAARSPGVVGDHLRSLGVPCGDEQVVTSAQAAARMVAGLVEPGSAVLVVGGAGLREALGEHGLRATSTLDDHPSAVVQGFSPDLTWQLLAEGSYAVAQGLPWVAANLDATVPTQRGRAPGNGTFVSAISTATGRVPMVAGKPERALFDEAVTRAGARRALVVGDRLDTDIEGASRAGLDSLLVLTGVTSATEAVLAAGGQRPTYVGQDLRALVEPARVAEREGEFWRCGDWVSLVEAGRVLVVPVPDAVGDRLDVTEALTAACAAGWAYDGRIDGVDGLPAGLG